MRATTNGISSFAGDFASQLASVLTPDFVAVAIAQHRFEHNSDAHGQVRDFPDALHLQRWQRIKETLATLAGVEFLQRFEFVVHSVVVMSSEVETSLAALSGKYPEIPRLRSE
jgi:hypothetical protein